MVMIIAEAGVNHNGDPHLAHDLIEAAKMVGADAVKFQMFDPERLDPPGKRRDMLKPLVLPPLEFRKLKDHADGIGLEFIATPFDVDNLQFLVALGVNYIKIGSADLRNRRLIREASKGEARVIISTGMATRDDVANAIHNVRPYPIVLQCTSSYPCPVEDINLRVIAKLIDDWQHYDITDFGLSDHSLSLVIPAAAVAMGASIIEKHMTLDRRMDGPDHRASLEPRDFSEMVANVREVETALGDGIKRPMPSEAAVIKVRDEREAHRCVS